MKIGYIRCSSSDQNTARQEVLMQELGVEQVYIDRMSGRNTDRPELQRMMNYVREGDTVIVESISRFARNTRDLLELIDYLNRKNVEFVSKKESLDTSTPTGKFMLTIFGAVAELEREYILQRQREGVEIAKANGVYKGRKPIERENFAQVVTLWESGRITAVEAMKRLNLKPSTFYRKVRKWRGGGTESTSFPFGSLLCFCKLLLAL
ncbi:MAG: recombinase family protein [Clostridia bacterium]|nr:recombinase family protein [Clostridia bacterium]